MNYINRTSPFQLKGVLVILIYFYARLVAEMAVMPRYGKRKKVSSDRNWYNKNLAASKAYSIPPEHYQSLLKFAQILN